jgi:hypothetical protein
VVLKRMEMIIIEKSFRDFTKKCSHRINGNMEQQNFFKNLDIAHVNLLISMT